MLLFLICATSNVSTLQYSFSFSFLTSPSNQQLTVFMSLINGERPAFKADYPIYRYLETT